MTASPPVDPDCRVEPSPELRATDGGRVLIGGSPLTILRLSPAGAELARSWFGGAPVGDGRARGSLARRLQANGMAHLRWPAGADQPDQPAGPAESAGTAGTGTASTGRVAIVIPVRDDPEGLARTLGSLGAATSGPPTEIVVVDDASTTPVGPVDTAQVGPVDTISDDIGPVGIGGIDAGPLADDPTVRVVRRPEPGGPGTARQTGLDGLTAPIVVMVDAGVTVSPGAIDDLLAAFDDPAVVAAAPRVRSDPLPHPVGRYDARRSPLDLGPSESLVGPGRTVPYVPTACLAVQSSALETAGGFDPALRYGEDVDLVWRLGGLGLVRYLPGVEVWHRPRPDLAAMVAQRRSYGSAAAPLATRHGAAALSPTRVSGWTLLVAALALGGRPLAALTAAAGTGLALRPKIEPLPDVTVEALILTFRGHGYGILSLGTAALRAWAPPLLALGLLPTPGVVRRAAWTLLAIGAGRRLLDGPREPAAAALDLGLGLVDDLAYCAGVWQGAVAERSLDALRPVPSAWPGGGPTIRERARALAGRASAAIRR